MDSPEIKHRDLSLEECMPDPTVLDQYQENAYRQIKWDGNGKGTIKGLLARPYMLAGILEEIDEMTIDLDRVEPAYSRFGALVMMEGNEKLMPGSTTSSAIERHIKEFGDVSWYLANYLNLYQIEFSRTIPVGLAAWHLDSISQPRSSSVFSAEIEKAFPWFHFFTACGGVKTAAQGIQNIPRDERIPAEQALLIASGKLVTTMAHMSLARFGVSYEDVLQGNKAKLEKRIQDGTVFDKSGGDDR
jgi:hypothetical protein